MGQEGAVTLDAAPAPSDGSPVTPPFPFGLLGARGLSVLDSVCLFLSPPTFWFSVSAQPDHVLVY